MNIDEFSIRLANALRGACAGDNSQLLILEQMKENPIQYCQSLLQIINSDESLRANALIELKNIINSKFELFPPDFVHFLCNQYINLYIIINDPKQLRIMVSTFIKLYDFFGQQWANFSSVFNPDQNKLSFQIELLLELLLKLTKNAEFIIDHMALFLQLALIGLQQDDWDLRIKSIRITFQMATFDPDAVVPHINIILSLIQGSPSYPEQLFLSLWIEFGSLIETVEIPQEQLKIVFQAAIQSLQSEHLSTDSKVQALITISLLPFINEQTAMEILNHSFNLAIIKAQMGEFLDSVKDLFEKAADDYGSPKVYSFLKGKINQSMSSKVSVSETICVSLYIMKSIIEQIGAEIRSDWIFYNQLIDIVSKSKQEENPLLFESCLMFIASLNSDFEMQLLESHLFGNFTIPLIVSPSPEIRYHAKEAVYNALDSISVPVAGIADKIWSINSMVTTDQDKYLTLLAKAIEQEEELFETEKALQLSQFLLTCFNGNNEQIIIGALSIATILILTNEAVHQVLLQPTIEITQKCLNSENIEVQINGLKRMSSLFPFFKERFLPQSIQKVDQLIQSSNQLVIEKAATCFYVIAKEMDQKIIIDKIIPVFQQWIILQNKDYFATAVTAVQSLAPVLDLAKTAEIMSNICEVAMKTNDEEIVSDCFDAISAILTKIADITSRTKVIEIVSKFSLAFMKGEFVICQQNAPLDCDFMLSTLRSFGGLLCNLLQNESALNAVIFVFAKSLIEKQKIDYIDIALSIYGDGILYNGFNQPQEKTFIISYIETLCNSNTDLVLIHNIANVLLCLVEKRIINELMSNKLSPIIIQWWQHLYNTMKEVMSLTLSNLAILIWAIVLKFGQQLIPEVFAQTFDFFPPKDNDDIPKMYEMLMQIVSNPQLRGAFSIQIALAISKVIIMPKMMLLRKGIPDNFVTNLAEVLNDLFKSNPNIQALVLQQAGNSQVSQSKIMNIIH